VAVKFAPTTATEFSKEWLNKMEKIAKKASGKLDGNPVKIETTGEIIKDPTADPVGRKS